MTTKKQERPPLWHIPDNYGLIGVLALVGSCVTRPSSPGLPMISHLVKLRNLYRRGVRRNGK